MTPIFKKTITLTFLIFGALTLFFPQAQNGFDGPFMKVGLPFTFYSSNEPFSYEQLGLSFLAFVLDLALTASTAYLLIKFHKKILNND
ncbi:MAG: hypothetical protein JWO09_2098 [Bacteroidetes bacterium]|nr:hypothetical protein [Bacteroidota bacterium]